MKKCIFLLTVMLMSVFVSAQAESAPQPIPPDNPSIPANAPIPAAQPSPASNAAAKSTTAPVFGVDEEKNTQAKEAVSTATKAGREAVSTATKSDKLSGNDRTILQKAIRGEGEAYLSAEGRIVEKGGQRVPPRLASILLQQQDLSIQRGTDAKWEFVSTHTRDPFYTGRTETTRTFSIEGDTWIDETVISKYSGDEVSRQGTTIRSRSVNIGTAEKPIFVSARVSKSAELYDKSGKKIGAVVTEFLNKEQAIAAAEARGADKDIIEQLRNSPESYTAPGDISIVKGGKVIVKQDPSGNLFDSNGNPLDKIVDHETNKPYKNLEEYLKAEGIPEEDIERFVRKLNNQALDNGIRYTSFLGTFGKVFDALGFWRSAGFLLRAYEQYSGLAKVTTLTWSKGWNREKIAQEFCIGAGIENCAVSGICGEIHELKADNILAGRDASGKLTTSAALNAQRSKQIIVANLSRQQLIDILGNTSIIKGRRVDLTLIDPESLGDLSIRLYHVEFSVTNTLDENLRFNLEFRRSAPVTFEAPVRQNISSFEDLPGTDFDAILSSIPPSNYGEAVFSAAWFPAMQIVDNGKRAHDHKYKYSTNEYDTVCLVFEPGLPSGGALSGKVSRQLCVPFREYTGGPQSIEQARTQQSSSEPARPQQEGGNV